MNTYKCPQCGLVNWETSVNCKRCSLPNSQSVEPMMPNTNISNHSSVATQTMPDSFIQNLNYNAPPPPNFYKDRVGTYSMGNSQPYNPGYQSGVNTICGMCGIQSNSMKKLYEGDVCKKCHRQYISRRQAAFLVDLLVYRGLFTVLIILAVSALGDSLAIFGLLLSFFPILIKDATGGRSFGKFIAGLRTVDFTTKESCGIGKSILRNIILYVPLMLLIELVFIQNGKRLGDRISNTRVIWNKYENANIFWI